MEQLNRARLQGFWAYQKERVKIALQIDSQRKAKTLPIIFSVFLLLFSLMILYQVKAASAWREGVEMYGVIGDVAVSPIFYLVSLVGFGIALWSAVNLLLAAARWTTRSVRSISTYTLIIGLSVMLFSLLTDGIWNRFVTLGFAIIPMVAAGAVYWWHRIEPLVLAKYRQRPVVRRRLRIILARRRARLSMGSVFVNLTLLGLIFLIPIIITVFPFVRGADEEPVYYFDEWMGYQVQVKGGFIRVEDHKAWQDHRADALPPVTLVYATVRSRVIGSTRYYEELYDIHTETTVDRLRLHDVAVGPVHSQVAEVKVHRLAGFMLCRRQDVADECSRWVETPAYRSA